jgi:dynein heavy chain
LTEKEIDEIREKYRDSAYYASYLYFLVSEMITIDPMYQYSLQWFENLFQMTLEKSQPNSDIPTRLTNIKQYFVQAIYEGVCVSLYSQHKLLFSFLVTVKTLQAYNQIDSSKFNYFLTGNVEDTKTDYAKFDYIPENTWPILIRELAGINKLNNCEGILESFLTDSQSWKSYFESSEPENEELPGNWDNLLDEFDKLLILKAFRLDKLTNGIQKFIHKKMGEKFVEVPIIKLEEIFQTSNAILPLIFMISSGSDPKADFDNLSMKNGIKSVGVISLGQGQGPKAEKLIKEASKPVGEGGWVLLQNCHLAISWLPRLETICEEFSVETVHPDFRLWMTTMPCSVFPVSILRNSKKMTIEPPKSFKANLKITYNQLDNKILDSCKTKPEEFRKLLFGLSIFHAVIQERKKYGSIGWNIPYEFTQEDFLVCRRQMLSFLEEYEEIPYKVLNFVFAEINYGGRVTDDKDTLLINALIKAFINPGTLETGHKFSKSDIYYSINGNNQTDYLNYIESLPIYTNPEIMGLHQNSEIMTNQNESSNLLKQSKAIQPSTSSNMSSDGENQSFALISSIKLKIPQLLNIQKIKLKFPIIYEDSLNTVLIQEATKFNELIDTIIKSMDNLKLAVEGLIVLNFDLEQVLNDITNYVVPKLWSNTFLSLKPLFSWLDELNQRIQFFEDWTNNGTPNVFWFNAFSFPQAFLTGTLQNYARKTKTAIDKLTFDFKMMGKSDFLDAFKKPDIGVLIYGLFLEGARWDYLEEKLNEEIPNELYSKAPVIWLIPSLKTEKDLSGYYRCPLYKTLTRSGTLTTTGHSSNFVMNIDFECKLQSDHWVRRGAACFLALKN